MRKFSNLIFCIALVFNTTFGQAEEDLYVGNFSVSEIAEDTSSRPGINMMTELQNYPSSTLSGVAAEKANKQYDALGFMASATIYTELFKKKSKDINSLARIANSYRLNQNTEAAAYWYAHFIHQTKDPLHYLHYAEVLKSNNNCEAAKVWFDKYKMALGEEGANVSVNDCEEIKTFQTYDKIKIKNAISLNSESSDFCAIPVGKGVVFTSSCEIKRHFKNRDYWTNERFTDLFYAEQRSNGDFKKPIPIEGNLNTKLHEGIATFNEAGTVMIFTRNNKKRGGKKNIKNLQLFIAYKGADGYWSNAEALPFNSSDFSSCHATLSKDNLKIYFASDRSGGRGGFDLYVSNFEEGEWSAPQNLGPKVNSSGNELFPFIGTDKVLYFSSNGHNGLGGLDVFLTKPQDTSWAVPVHLGAPLNSPKDDFGFFVDEEKERGFLSSNRKDGEGKDDIYTFQVNGKWPFEDDFLTADIRVYELDTDSPLSEAYVTITEKLPAANTNITEVASYWVTETDGTFAFKVKRGNAYLFEIAKEGYAPLKKYVTAEGLIKESSFGLKMLQQKYRDFKILINDLRENKSEDNFQIRIKNKKTKAVFLLPFNQLNEGLASLECGNSYEVTLLKNKKPYKTIHLKLPENCNVQKPGELMFNINPEELVVVPKQYYEVNEQLPSDQAPRDWTPEMFKDYFLGDRNGNFKAGQVITLRDVFYDFDRYGIRPDASQDLDRVAELMKRFPNIKIVLEAHADFRGAEHYNQKLSNDRAESAKQYILGQGIDVRRLSTQGFGESRPKINCTTCSDEEHQLNRRTEIRVVEF